MLCYMDRTFCPYWEECEDGVNCGRALTPAVIEAAKAGEWGIARFGGKPECFVALTVKGDADGSDQGSDPHLQPQVSGQGTRTQEESS